MEQSELKKLEQTALEINAKNELARQTAIRMMHTYGERASLHAHASLTNYLISEPEYLHYSLVLKYIKYMKENNHGL